MNLQLSQSIAQKQSMVVSAQLQQAIHLLQMSNHDLQSYVDAEAENNPFLNVATPKGEAGAQRTQSKSTQSRAASGSEFDYISSMAEAPKASLYAHVSAQFDVMFDVAAERAIAEVFLEALEPTGWIGESIDILAAKTGQTTQEAEEFLYRVQKVEPSGLFARTLMECLALQADDRGWMTSRFYTVLENLPMLAKADIKGLARKCACDEAALRDELRKLRCLNPKPGADFDMGDMVQRAPDLIVTKGDKGWVIDLNRSNLPSIAVDEGFAKRIGTKADAKDYVGERLSVARWLHRAVEYRNNTTLAVGAEILRRQEEFFVHGPSHLRPMILRDVADEIGVHESTVSRVTTGMLIQTPHGTFPLKMFFNAALGKENGSEAGSAAAVRHMISKLIKEEDPCNPLSDDDLARRVSETGTPLARRTVAKYRDMLNIPSSFQRRRSALLSA